MAPDPAVVSTLMRAKLGAGLAVATAVSLLTFGAPGADAQLVEAPPSPSSTTTTTVPPTTVGPTTTQTPTTTTEAPTTTVEPTTTAVPTTTTIPAFPGAVSDDDSVDISQLSVPGRGTIFQTQPLPPPPTTTTTTTTLPDPTILPANSGTGRRAVYSKSAQRVWAVESDGTVVKTHRVSGKLLWCDPRVGTYEVWSRSRHTYSINNPTIKWGYMVRFTKGCNGGNIGFHEIPTQYGSLVQSIAQLGQPLSGGCVRQAQPDAIWMWNWAQIGTKVVVLP